jgi:Tol biopolymer transport system component
MKHFDRLERDLTDWFADIAVPRTPDYTDDILRQTAGARQRPSWSFPERWIPLSVVNLGRRTLEPVPWRMIGVLAILALLLVVAIASFVGSQRRLPSPFGLAANGLVAYANGGDIFTVDPGTGTRRAIVTGQEKDHDPRWSLDGTRLLFLRESGSGDIPIIIDADGSNVLVVKADPIAEVDAESIAWSPNGRSIAMIGRLRGDRDLLLVDAVDGGVTSLDANYQGADLYWRPPDGRQVMYLGGSPADLRLFLISVDGGSPVELSISGAGEGLRPAGWTPDGRSFAFQRPDLRTSMVAVATGAETVIPVAFPQLSNDGNRIAGLNTTDDESQTWLCVASVTGGPCHPMTPKFTGEWGTDYRWSPNDEWILTTRSDGSVLLLDPDRDTTLQPSWTSDGAESWQRIAP